MQSDEIIELLKKQPGLSDRQITDSLFGPEADQQTVNQVCRRLLKQRVLVRTKRPDGILGNYLSNAEVPDQPVRAVEPVDQQSGPLSEDGIKRMLEKYLGSQGWAIRTIAWGKRRGLDIDAEQGTERWIVEVKGIGSSEQMQGNYFLAVLGEILFRMTDPNAKYSIAVPDVPRFRKLWQRLPALAKSRTGFSALFVDTCRVEEST